MRGTILGGGGFQQGGVQHLYLAVLDLDAPEPKPWFLQLGFLGHAVALDPRDHRRALVFEKKGPGAALVRIDRDARSVTPLPTRPNRHFYGHGLFSPDAAVLYATEACLDEGGRGVLVIRDGDTLQELGLLPTGGASPHDCVLIDEGRTMVVTHGGGPVGGETPCVTWVDVATEQVKERMVLASEVFNTGHIAITPQGDLAVVSAPRDGLPTSDPGAVTLRTAGGPPRTLTEPVEVTRQMLGETLSVLIHEPTGAVLATHPAGDMATLWDLHTGALRKVWTDLRGVRGVTLTHDQRCYVLSHILAGTVALTLVDVDTLQTVGHVSPSFTSGSHIYNVLYPR